MEATRVKLGPAFVSDLYEAVDRGDETLLERVQRKLSVAVLEDTEEKLVFELTGIDAALANAFRRILLAEVPSMAIERVYMFNNTGIMQDEVLAHRLGLVPLAVDPRPFHFPRMADEGEDAEHSDMNTLVFRMDVACEAKPRASKKDATEGVDDTLSVYSSSLEWVPQGRQAETFPPIQPVHPNILLTKLKPGQRIEAELHAVKGVGKDHAKFSPVATAAYRLLPDVRLLQEVEGKHAEELVARCPWSVFDIEDAADAVGGKRAKVSRPRDCSMCRECIRGDGWDERVELTRVQEHYIFSVETVGALPPKVLFKEAVGIMKAKTQALLDILDGDLEEIADM